MRYQEVGKGPRERRVCHAALNLGNPWALTPDGMHEASWSDAKGSSTWKRPRHADQAHRPAEQEVPAQIGTENTTHSDQA